LRYSPFFGCALAAVLAGCGGGLGTTNVNPTTANVRFVNGSPDQPALALVASGTAITATIPFGELSAYTPIASGTYTLSAAATGTTALPGTTTTGVSFTAGLNYTIVAGGSMSSDRLLCVFPEPLYATATNAAVVNFHDCSPGSTSPIAVGTFTIANPAVESQLGPPIMFKLTSGAQSVQQPAGGTTGTGIYANSPSVAQLLPSSLDTNDVNNFLPFTGAGGEEDLNLSAYIVDGTTAAGTTRIIGVFDGN
jgi:hypothetical protein